MIVKDGLQVVASQNNVRGVKDSVTALRVISRPQNPFEDRTIDMYIYIYRSPLGHT